MKIEIEIDDRTASLLAVLDEERSVQSAIGALIDHAAQGVYRPGSWEREWVMQVFHDEFLVRLEPGDPYGRMEHGRSRFVRPKQ